MRDNYGGRRWRTKITHEKKGKGYNRSRWCGQKVDSTVNIGSFRRYREVYEETQIIAREAHPSPFQGHDISSVPQTRHLACIDQRISLSGTAGPRQVLLCCTVLLCCYRSHTLFFIFPSRLLADNRGTVYFFIDLKRDIFEVYICFLVFSARHETAETNNMMNKQRCPPFMSLFRDDTTATRIKNKTPTWENQLETDAHGAPHVYLSHPVHVIRGGCETQTRL